VAFLSNQLLFSPRCQGEWWILGRQISASFWLTYLAYGREAEAALRAARMSDSRATSMAEDNFDYDDFCSTMLWLSHCG